MEKPAEKSEAFFDMIADWQALETRAIEDADSMLAKTDNPVIRAVMDFLKLDAQKHCHVQQMIMNSVMKEAARLSPDEMNMLSEYLNRHLDVEEKTIAVAEEALKKSEVFFTHYLLEYLIADVKNHRSMIRRLDDELKSASIPTSVSARV